DVPACPRARAPARARRRGGRARAPARTRAAPARQGEAPLPRARPPDRVLVPAPPRRPDVPRRRARAPARQREVPRRRVRARRAPARPPDSARALARQRGVSRRWGREPGPARGAAGEGGARAAEQVAQARSRAAPPHGPAELVPVVPAPARRKLPRDRSSWASPRAGGPRVDARGANGG